MTKTKPDKEIVLKVEGGKLVTLKRKNGEATLCAEDVQQKNTKAHKMDIWTRVRDNRKQIAFRCKKGNAYYFPKVVQNLVEKKLVGPLLKVVKAPCSATLEESHWFEKVKTRNGSYYGLRSVAQPKWYLSWASQKSGEVSIREDDNQCVYVMDEKIRAEDSTKSA